jgi:hypothetical protein
MNAGQLDDMDARPGYNKKTPIRHPVHLNGMIHHFRVKPNHEVVWKVSFLEDPGVAAIEHKEWYRQSSLIHRRRR